MNKPDQDPGHATLAELAAYWRMPSKRAARELARALGLRRVRGEFPWFAIWQAERIAPPSKKRWDELKHPHLTTTDLAELLGESKRSAQRRDHSKPDAGFPDPVPIRKKPKLWRASQVNAWCAGLPVPVYRVKSRSAQVTSTETPKALSKTNFDGFDPYAQKRFAAKPNGKMTASTANGKTDEHP